MCDLLQNSIASEEVSRFEQDSVAHRSAVLGDCDFDVSDLVFLRLQDNSFVSQIVIRNVED